MEPSNAYDVTVVHAHTFWFWQLKQINAVRKKMCHGWLGWFSWKFEDSGTVTSKITYINIRPFIGKLILRHEQGHQTITRRCKEAATARLYNAGWDAETWHGLLFWKKP